MKKNNLQDIFLNSVRKNRISVTIFLFNGIKLQGFIAGFDNFVINLKRDNQLQLVYKHAISTILPSENVDMTIVESDIESENENDEVAK